MTTNRFTRTLVAALAVALLGAGVAFAQGPLATATAGSAQIDWHPATQHGLTLKVTGPQGFSLEQQYAPGETMTFSVFDELGETLPSGSYTFELHPVVEMSELDAATRDAVRQARETGADASGILQKAGATLAGAEAQVGHFRIVGGSIVMGGQEEPDAGAPAGNRVAAKDQVFLDDVIVDGSLCVGFDCVNGENFGFDTLRLKENNLRIHFDDTSSSGSFPANDWRLVANDSANGGANRFTIEDSTAGRNVFTVEAGARNNALYVDDGGRVGIGTATPVVEAHVVDGDSPTLRLEQNGSSGFTPQTWDIAGNETNFFVRDATNGSRLPFKIRPGADTDSLVIESNGDVTMSGGNVGIGTTSPGSILHLVDGAAVRYRLENTAAGTQWDTTNDGSGDYAISVVGSGQSELEIEQDGDIGNCTNPDHDFVLSVGPACTATPRSWIDAGDPGFTTTSSRTVKENFEPVEVTDILAKFREIPVLEYDFIDGPKDRIGLMAEDFHRIFGRGSDTEINSHEMQVAMWLAIQELIGENQTLRTEIEELKAGLGE